MWGKKRAKSDKGKPIKKYYIKSEEKHYIWVKWKNPFSDKPDIVWSAEPQSNFTTPELKNQIKSKLSDKKIWPFPSAADVVNQDLKSEQQFVRRNDINFG